MVRRNRGGGNPQDRWHGTPASPGLSFPHRHAFRAPTGCRLARPCVAAMSPVGGSVSFDHRAARRSWGGKRGSPGGFVVGRSRRRSEERSVGKGCVRTCRSRWSQYNSKKNKTSQLEESATKTQKN